MSHSILIRMKGVDISMLPQAYNQLTFHVCDMPLYQLCPSYCLRCPTSTQIVIFSFPQLKINFSCLEPSVVIKLRINKKKSLAIKLYFLEILNVIAPEALIIHTVNCFEILSVESQKGVISIQLCSVENQKGAISVQSLWR